MSAAGSFQGRRDVPGRHRPGKYAPPPSTGRGVNQCRCVIANESPAFAAYAGDGPLGVRSGMTPHALTARADCIAGRGAFQLVRAHAEADWTDRIIGIDPASPATSANDRKGLGGVGDLQHVEDQGGGK